MKKIAIMGGSFNPPHIGHVQSALYVKATQDVDEVWIEPVYKHPAGKELLDYDHRVAMCCEAFVPHLRHFSVNYHEVDAVERGGTGKTIELLRYITETYNEGQFKDAQFKLVLGSDILYHLDQWPEWEEINKMVEVVILARPGFPDFKRTVGPVQQDLSSTYIREIIKFGYEKTLKELLPTGVRNYIKEHKLYGYREQNGI